MAALLNLGPLFPTYRRAILAIVFAGLCFANVAYAQMPTSISVQAERTGSGDTTEALYELHVGTGDKGAAFGLEYELPSWPGSEKIVGSPIVVTSVMLIGPGTIRPATPPPVLKPRPKKRSVCLRGRSSGFGKAYWVEVPGNGAAVVQIRGRASYPGWPRSEYKLSVSTFDADSPDAARSALQTVATGALGARGVHILMGVGHPRALRKMGMSPEIVGQTEPPLRFVQILLRAVRPTLSDGVGIGQWDSPSKVMLGSVRTNSRGQFRLAPKKFPLVGEYAILARSQARAGLSADWNCGPFF